MSEFRLDTLIGKFTADTVPRVGRDEDTDIGTPYWKVSENGNDPSLPGGGLGRYSMLYIGEANNKMYLIHGGKVVWTFSTGRGDEYDDIWMLKTGNILFSRMEWAGEVTPDKEIVWKYENSPGEEIHTLQPVGDECVLMAINSLKPRIVLINKKSGEMVREWKIPFGKDVSIHGQCRRMRYTAQKTFLISHLTENKVVEYDENMHSIWQYDVTGPWAAVRLKNGNTLITSEGEDRTIEVSPQGKIVWEIKLSDLPLPYRLTGSQSCVRLNNGNTILCSRGNGGLSPQLVEITPDNKVVWCLSDWKNLGPATAIQVLSENAVSEIPGDCER